MSKPPARLDGALVICWAWSGEEPFGVIKSSNGSGDLQIFGLAICRYDDGLIYRFSCDRNWEVEQDSDYETVEEAKDNLPSQYKNVPVKWVENLG